jgi:hypothetical protein
MTPAPRSAQVTLDQLSDGQSLVRRTLAGFLAVSTELANRAVSSICLAGLSDWSLACVSLGFAPLSSSGGSTCRGSLRYPLTFARCCRHLQRVQCSQERSIELARSPTSTERP